MKNTKNIAMQTRTKKTTKMPKSTKQIPKKTTPKSTHKNKRNIFLPYSTQSIDKQDIKRVKLALKSPLLTQGELCEEFERNIAQYVGVKYALCFNSATSALYCAYRALFKQGELVITTPNSFVATANMRGRANLCRYFAKWKYQRRIYQIHIAKQSKQNQHSKTAQKH